MMIILNIDFIAWIRLENLIVAKKIKMKFLVEIVNKIELTAGKTS